MKTKLLLTLTTTLVLAVFLFDPVPQDSDYHNFADTRTFLGIPNFWNLVSNLPFLFVGSAGLWQLRSPEPDRIVAMLHPAYVVFFAGVFLTGIGSSWYHFAPDNSTLMWDRLPMTIAFMAFFTIIIGEYVSIGVARRLLVPLLVIGAASVFYWQYTEVAGRGDLRPYALVQFLPMVLIPVILLTYEPRIARRHVFWGMIALYAASKMFEHLDYYVYETGGILSGHSIKHLVAAGAPALFLHSLKPGPQRLSRPTHLPS